jgi:hypothetical protein
VVDIQNERANVLFILQGSEGHSSNLKIETAGSSKTFVNFFYIIRHYIPDDRNLWLLLNSLVFNPLKLNGNYMYHPFKYIKTSAFCPYSAFIVSYNWLFA